MPTARRAIHSVTDAASRDAAGTLTGPARASAATEAVSPVGTLTWITPELIAKTIDCWQPHFSKALTIDDAIEILTNVSSLLGQLE